MKVARLNTLMPIVKGGSSGKEAELGNAVFY